jgi:hypothetical protein
MTEVSKSDDFYEVQSSENLQSCLRLPNLKPNYFKVILLHLLAPVPHPPYDFKFRLVQGNFCQLL